jgi:hypothetical protein
LRRNFDSKGSQNNFPMMKTTDRDHKMNWQPASAARGLDLRPLVNGIFGGQADQDTGLVESRFGRQ